MEPLETFEPLFLRIARMDENMAPQADQGTLRAALEKAGIPEEGEDQYNVGE